MGNTDISSEPRLDRRWPWLVAGTLLVLAGLAAGVASYLWWLPCRGQMLIGTAWVSGDQVGFSEACLERMDEGTAFPGTGYALTQTPGLAMATAATMLLTGVAWLVLVWTQIPRLTVGAVLTVPGIMVVGLGGMIAVNPAGPQDGDDVTWLLVKLLAVALLAALVAIVANRRGRDSIRWLIALGAVGSFGLVGLLVDYALMVSWSEADWDSPPGSGYPTAVWLVICGLTLMLLSRPGAQRSTPAAPQQVEQVDAIA